MMGKKQDDSIPSNNETKLTEIQKVHDYYRKIISCMPNNVYWLNRECVTQGCNNNILKLVGLKTLDEFIGLDYKRMGEIANWTEGQAESFMHDDMEVMSKGIAKYNVEEPPLYDLNGNPVYYLSSRVPIFDDTNRNVIGVIGISVDITSRKLMENELRQAKIDAEASSRAKTAFISNMSHDLKGPLTGMLNSAAMLEESVLSGLQKEMARNLSKCSKQLSNLLTAILDTIKSDNTTENDLHLVTFDVRKLIQDVQEIYILNAASKKLEIKAEINNNVPRFVVTDRTKLFRVLFNIIGNAIKFTETGYVVIKVEFLGETENKVILKFSVKDTGIGISDDFQNKVFNLFSRENPSSKGTYEGYGIGLHMALNYVRALGSEINLVSKKNKGATFSFELLLEKGTASDEKIYKQNSKFEISKENLKMPEVEIHRKPTYVLPELPPLSTKPVVLLIEDDTIIMSANEYNLRKAGYLTIGAPNGEEGLKLAKTARYDIILTDLGLPGISGDELALLVRHWEKSSNKPCTPIVAYTGNATDPDVVRICLEAGMNTVIDKPAEPAAIVNLLNELIKSSRQGVDKNTSSNIQELNVPKAASSGLSESEQDIYCLDDLPLFHFKTALAICSDEESVNTGLEILRKTMPQSISELQSAYDQKNWQMIRNISHRIKGAASTIGLVRMEHACQYLEKSHTKDSQDQLEKLYHQMMEVIADTNVHINDFLKGETRD